MEKHAHLCYCSSSHNGRALESAWVLVSNFNRGTVVSREGGCYGDIVADGAGPED